jgi:hypothetical protein
VADIIKLDKHRQQQQTEKEESLRDEKIEVLKRILQCARCQLKCSRCGAQTQDTKEGLHSTLPYPLCSGCGEEYKFYLKRRRGEKPAGRNWHNEEWMEVWRTWLKHQEALDQYRDSKEFIKLLHELDSLC